MKMMSTWRLDKSTIIVTNLTDGIKHLLVSPENIVFGYFLELSFLTAFLDFYEQISYNNDKSQRRNDDN